MTDPHDAQPDPRKVRIGLVIISLVVVVALVAMALVDAAPGKALMFAIAAVAFVRAFLLVRWLRAER